MLRSLRSFRSFRVSAAVAVLALALGTGANAMLFSVVNAVLLAPSAFEDAEGLVVVRRASATEQVDDEALSERDVSALREGTRAFAGLTAIGFSTSDLTGIAEPEQTRDARIDPEFLRVLGVRPLLGRGFTPEEAAQASPVAMLDEDLWRKTFGGDPQIVGKTVQLNGRPITVVGVMPHLRIGAQEWELFRPRRPAPDGPTDPRVLTVVARRAPGTTLAGAQEQVATVARRLAVAFPKENADWSAAVHPLREWEQGKTRPALLVLVGAVAVVLLLACSNVAHLQLAQAARREREFALRSALGASRAALAGRLLRESAALALAGGVLGLAIGNALLPALLRVSPLTPSQREGVAFDWRVLVVTLGVALVCALVVGLLPAVRASRPDVQGALKGEGMRTATGGRASGRVRAVLVASQLALAAALVAGAGLLAKSFVRLTSVDRGYDPTQVVTTGIVLPNRVYDTDAKQGEFFRATLERLRATPGVTHAAAANFPPGFGGGIPTQVTAAGVGEGAQPAQRLVNWRVITGDFFGALRIPVLRGRTFDGSDRPGGPLAVVVSRALAERYFPDRDAVGQELRFALFGPRPVTARIVGVVGDVRHAGRDQAATADLYLAFEQQTFGYMNYVVRGTAAPEAMLASIRRAVLAVDPARPTFTPMQLAWRADDDTARTRFGALLMGAFAVLAALVAALGVASVAAYAVAERTRELGIRVALGAQRRHVVTLVARPGVQLVAAGVGLGLLGALAASRAIGGLLFGVSPRDPLVYLATALALGAVAALASIVPARRALRVDPVTALRAD
jgi:predicted permease